MKTDKQTEGWVKVIQKGSPHRKRYTLKDIVESAHNEGVKISVGLVPQDDTLLNILHACQNGRMTCRKAAERIEHLFARRKNNEPEQHYRFMWHAHYRTAKGDTLGISCGDAVALTRDGLRHNSVAITLYRGKEIKGKLPTLASLRGIMK